MRVNSLVFLYFFLSCETFTDCIIRPVISGPADELLAVMQKEGSRLMEFTIILDVRKTLIDEGKTLVPSTDGTCTIHSSTSFRSDCHQLRYRPRAFVVPGCRGLAFMTCTLVH